MKRKNLIAFVIGMLLHILFWCTSLGWEIASTCTEVSCYGFLLLEFPISLFYSGTAERLTYGSLVFGTIWWGVVAVLVMKLFSSIKSAFKNELGIK